MKLQSRINLLSLATLILLTGSLVVAGFLVISDIVLGMNRRLLNLELDNRMAVIEEGHGLLVRTGVARIENYEDRMRAEVLDAFRAFSLGRTGKVSVFGEGRKILLHPEAAPHGGTDRALVDRMIAEGSGAVTFRRDGRTRFGLFRTFEPWNWVVLLSISRAEMYEKRTEYLVEVSAVALAILALNLFLFSRLMNQFVRRIQATLRCAHRVMEGDLSARIDPIPVSDEIGSLQRTINAMVARIEERTRESEQAREALRESKERYQGYIENAPDLVFVLDGAGRILETNAAAAAATGYPREALPGMAVSDLIHGPVGEPENGEVRVARRDGTAFPALMETVAISGDRRLGFCKDISERKLLEDELQQAHKMEALGTLAGGIAHDINNILAVALGNIELASEAVAPGQPGGENLTEAHAACLRGKDVVGRILAFSRKAERRCRALRMTPVLTEAVKLLRSSAPSFIAFRQEITAAADGVLADETALHQMLMNLMTNAVHAMEDRGGTLTVRLENTRIDGDGDPSRPAGEYLKLTVADTGHGMEPETIGKIFDPYFTTKSLGRGTGLGLSIVHGVARDLGGWVTVESTPGSGTTFRVFFPVADAPPDRPPVEAAETPRGTEQRILLVDDEDPVRTMGRKQLLHLGYRVECHGDPLADLASFRADPDGFDLVMTDMTMPGMTGDALVRELLTLRNPLPVILCTGYGDVMTEAEARALGVGRILIKPYTLSELAGTLRSLLDRPTP